MTNQLEDEYTRVHRQIVDNSIALENRISQIKSRQKRQQLAEMQRENEETRKKDEIRSQVVEFLREFNKEHYKTIKPLLERTPYHFFTISHDYIRLGETPYSCPGYSIALGDQPKVIRPQYDVRNSNPRLDRRLLRAVNLDSGRIIERDDCLKINLIIDVADRALVLTRGNPLRAVDAYQAEVKARFEDSLNWIIQYIGINEK